MTEINSGLRSLLKYSPIYQGFQRALGSLRAQRILAEQHITPDPESRVLDIGCGPAGILQHLPDCHYVGIDPNANYINAAKATFGVKGDFVVGDIHSTIIPDSQKFDIICALGVLHHLEDKEASSLCSFAARHLAPGGKFVTTDVVLLQDQRWIARKLAINDRGQNVRTPEGYRALVTDYFEDVSEIIWPDVYRVPYDANIMTCRSPKLSLP
jgi:SAM-dependent methyltransferase